MVAAWGQPGAQAIRRIKALLFLISLGPLVRLVAAGLADWLAEGEPLTLGVNPIELITRSTGTWTLVFLLVALAITPLRQLSGWNWVIRMRRMFGLFAFFYASLHFTTYIWLDQFFDPIAIVKDIAKRPFITVGFATFVLLIPLAVTSTNAMVRYMGGRRWVALHRLVYPISILAVLHYWWLVKRDVTQPAIYAAVLALLLGWRLWRRRAITSG